MQCDFDRGYITTIVKAVGYNVSIALRVIPAPHHVFYDRFHDRFHDCFYDRLAEQ